MFSVDGLTWDIPCTIERTAEVASSEISGMLLNKNYFNDVLGTWLRYSVTLAVPVDGMADYAALYEVLSAPVAGHTFEFPYNEGRVTIEGRVQVISDRWVRMPDNQNLWRQTRFEVISNSPIRGSDLPDVLDNLMELDVVDDGSYIAEQYGVAGFSRVNVNVDKHTPLKAIRDALPSIPVEIKILPTPPVRIPVTINIGEEGGN